MTQESIGYAREGKYPSIGRIAGADSSVDSRPTAKSSHAGHMRASRRRRRGIPRWVAVAVLTGAFVALAFVNYLAR